MKYAIILHNIPDSEKSPKHRELLSVLRLKYKTEESYKSPYLGFVPKNLQYEYYAIRAAIESFLK